MKSLKLVLALACASAVMSLSTGAIAAERNPLHPNYWVMDNDQDGKLTADEYIAYMKKMWDEMQADPNPLHPSYLNPGQFAEADKNADRKISREEFMAYVAQCWNDMDKGGNGVIAESTYSDARSNPLHPSYRSN